MAESSSGLPYAENDTVFRQGLVQVSKNKLLHAEIEKFYHEEMANGFNDIDTINYVDINFQIIQSLLEMTNPKPEKMEGIVTRKIKILNEKNEEVEMEYPYFDLTPSILRFFTKAKNLTVLMKSLDGKGVLNASESRQVQSHTERHYSHEQKNGPLQRPPGAE